MSGVRLMSIQMKPSGYDDETPTFRGEAYEAYLYDFSPSLMYNGLLMELKYGCT